MSYRFEYQGVSSLNFKENELQTVGDVYGYFNSFHLELKQVFNHCTAKFITNVIEQKVILFAINL